MEGDAAVEVAGKLVPGDEAIEEEVADFEGKMDDFRTQERNLGDALGEGLGIFPLTVHW